MQNLVLNPFHISLTLFIQSSLKSRYYYPHFMQQEKKKNQGWDRLNNLSQVSQLSERRSQISNPGRGTPSPVHAFQHYPALSE